MSEGHGMLKHTPITDPKHDERPEMKVLSKVAALLAADPRVGSGLVPDFLEVIYIEQLLRIMCAIFEDFVQSVHVSVLNGSLRMQWASHHEMNQVVAARWSQDPEVVERAVTESLDRIDFKKIEALATRTVKDSGIGIPGEHALFSQTFVLALVFFQLGSSLHRREFCAGGGSMNCQLFDLENASKFKKQNKLLLIRED